MKKYNAYLSAVLLFMVVLLTNCNKRDAYTTITPPAQANFLNATSGTYYVTNDPNSQFKIPIGVTTVSNSARTVTVSVTSPTNATASQYTIPSTTVTIPAGKAVDSLTVKGIFAGYAGTRPPDTLVFTINGGDAAASDYNNVYKLVLRKSCDVVAATLSGNYSQSTDFYNGAASTRPKYTGNISNWVATSATSATVNIKNVGSTSDNGWGYVTAAGGFSVTDPVITPGLTATLNWANPANLTVTIPLQNYFNDGSGVSTIQGTGTFSACDNTFTIVCTVKYAGNGSTYTHTTVFAR